MTFGIVGDMAPLYREADGELWLRQIPADAEPLDYCPDCRVRLEDCACGED